MRDWWKRSARSAKLKHNRIKSGGLSLNLRQINSVQRRTITLKNIEREISLSKNWNWNLRLDDTCSNFEQLKFYHVNNHVRYQTFNPRLKLNSTLANLVKLKKIAIFEFNENVCGNVSKRSRKTFAGKVNSEYESHTRLN